VTMAVNAWRKTKAVITHNPLTTSRWPSRFPPPSLCKVACSFPCSLQLVVQMRLPRAAEMEGCAFIPSRRGRASTCPLANKRRSEIDVGPWAFLG
jgi:hypothetical protein